MSTIMSSLPPPPSHARPSFTGSFNLGRSFGTFLPSPFFLSSPSFIVVAWWICSCPEELLRPAPMWQKIIHRFVFPPIFFLSFFIHPFHLSDHSFSFFIHRFHHSTHLFIYLFIHRFHLSAHFFSYYLYPPFPSIFFLPFFEGG